MATKRLKRPPDPFQRGKLIRDILTGQVEDAAPKQAEVAPSKLRKAVHEKHEGETVWNGVVHVFDLRGSPSGATRAYAWSYERDDGKRRFFAVLHLEPIKGPVDAVRAAIVAEMRAK